MRQKISRTCSLHYGTGFFFSFASQILLGNIRKSFNSTSNPIVLHLTSGYDVTVSLFSYRSQMTSKVVTTSVAHEPLTVRPLRVIEDTQKPQSYRRVIPLHSIVYLEISSAQLQVQGFSENFEDSCGDAISWISSGNYLPSYTEGWATYVEYPLMARDTNAYVNTRDKKILLQKYGMLKYQVSQRATSTRTQTHFWPLLVKKAGATCISANYFAFFPCDPYVYVETKPIRKKRNTNS